ncbi:MAG TPA: type I restriction endonuclease subunit R [Nitrospira sp.]|nr:type I restriction endonuclease subunit R [Nitrospira sp.]
MSGPEFQKVEAPLIAQLVRMGWKHTTGNLDHPSVTGRGSFREVLLLGELRAAITRINLRDGKPWLDEDRVSQAVSELDRISKPKLMEANQAATQLLVKGCDVEGLPGWDGGRSQTIHYIDWEHPERNTFRAINQFRLDTPGRAKDFIAPDIVLFVNGIPLVVIECKSPSVSEPMAEAIDQLRRYSNQRKASGEVEDNEGNERLFVTNQILVATSFDEARVGTIGADVEHYAPWRDAAPCSLDDVRKELGKAPSDALSLQETLVAGVLRPMHLLDVIRHFMTYQVVSGRTVKIVCRYPQYRAVHAAVARLQTGKTRRSDGEHDRRGGLIWHTQGSGKSLSMVFLVRKLRSIPALRKFKVVLVTDRTDLQKQLSKTATATNETVEVGTNIKKVEELLRRKGPGLVFAMIQKYREKDVDSEGPSVKVHASRVEPLNEDDSIVVLVDEAHRSHANQMHAHLLAALPNCACIGFTGTPIIMGAKKRTHAIFGEFLDRYTIKESEADGATVPILYEGRSAEGAVAEGGDLDQLFDRWFQDRPEDEREAIRKKYATKGAVLGEAEELIAAKADDMMRHYVEHILPNQLKAQLVAFSRLAAVRYRTALIAARDKLVKEAEALDAAQRALDDEALADETRKVRAAVRAARNLDLLKSLEFATVISPKHNDPNEWAEWSDGDEIETYIERFKKRLVHPDPSKQDRLAFLCVKSMLLTGFDAPVEGVMYLDRSIREAELLQAIARVNRTDTPQKTAGIVVDYYGVANHLTEALSAYSAEDIEGALRSLKDEIPKLRDRCQRTIDVFKSRGIDIDDEEGCIQLLKDERLRAEFTVKLKQFLASLDVVLPRPEGLPYTRPAKKLAMIYARARTRYREGMPVLAKSIGAKVRELIDEHVVSLGINPKIAPISITDAQFGTHVAGQKSPRAMASEMEHAARHHIKKHMAEDPVHFQKLSERLEKILEEFGQNWEQLSLALKPFVEEVRAGRKVDDTTGASAIEAPFVDLLKQEIEHDHPMSGRERQQLVGQVRELVQLIRSESKLVGFWKSATRQEELRGQVFTFLTDLELVEFARADEVADAIMELAKANQSKLAGADGVAK